MNRIRPDECLVIVMVMVVRGLLYGCVFLVRISGQPYVSMQEFIEPVVLVRFHGLMRNGGIAV